MKSAELVAIDTNILIIADDSSNLSHRKAKSILESALKGLLKACLSHQILAEYFSVITSSRRVKNPLSAKEAKDRIVFLNNTRRIKKIYPKHSTLRRCVELCAEKNLQGARVFDVYYAMTLLDNKVYKLITQNTKDFRLFKKLQLIDFNHSLDPAALN